MKDKIIELLKEKKVALSVHDISENLKIEGIDDFKELLKTLNEMEDSLEIYKTNKDNFMLFENFSKSNRPKTASAAQYGTNARRPA